MDLFFYFLTFAAGSDLQKLAEMLTVCEIDIKMYVNNAQDNTVDATGK